MVRDKASARRTYWIIFVLLGAVFLFSRLYQPEDSPARTLCGFKTLVGLPCPGCGLTRSFCAMARGELARSLHFNLLGPPLFLFAALFFVAALLGSIGLTAPISAGTRLLGNARFIKGLLATLIIYWGARIIYLLVTEGFAATIGHGLLARLWH